MPHHPVLDSQRRTVRELIVAAGLRPEEFSWGKVRSEATQAGGGEAAPTVDVLLHTPTGFSFAFDFDRHMHHYTVFRPGRDTPVQREFPGNWELQLGYVRNWLGFVAREYAATDPWAELGAQPELGALPSGVENTPFTAEEQARIGAILLEALESARRTEELTPDQVRTLEEKVDYLVEASRRLPRLDFRSVLVGAMVEVMVAEALPPGVVRHVLEFALGGLSALFGGPDFPELPRPA